jgi:hypothetical protein
VAAFAAHESGYLIMAAALQTHYAESMAKPEYVVELTYPALARRFHVSRSHVANVLRIAREAGWFDVARGGHLLEMSAALVDEFEHFIAEQAAYFSRLTEVQSAREVAGAAALSSGRSLN